MNGNATSNLLRGHAEQWRRRVSWRVDALNPDSLTDPGSGTRFNDAWVEVERFGG